MSAFIKLTGDHGQPVYVRSELVAVVSGWKTEAGLKTRVTAAYGAHEWVKEAPDQVVALLTGEATPDPEQRTLL